MPQPPSLECPLQLRNGASIGSACTRPRSSMDDDELRRQYYGALSDDAIAKIKGALEDNRTRKMGRALGESGQVEPGEVSITSEAASKESSHLKRDQGRQPSADSVRKHLEKRRTAEIDRLETDNK